MPRPKVAVAALVTLVLSIAVWAGGAAAQEATASSVGGTMRTPPADDAPPEPIEGIRFEVSLDGEEIGEDETDDEGRWSVEVPGPGTYQVTIDVDSLPDGIGLRDPERATLDNVSVRAGQAKNVLFPLDDGSGGGSSVGDRFDRIADLVANGVKVGLIVAMAAIGLSLIFGITGLVNFAHGEMVTIGAVATWYLNAGGPGLPLVLAALGGVAAGCLTGFVLEKGLFHPLRARRMNNISLMVVSIGLSQFLRHVILFIYGGAPRRYSDFTVQRTTDIGPFSLQPKDIWIMGLSLVVLLGVGFLLRRTRLGTAMRAVSDNRDLAESSGIDVQRIILVTWVAGGGLAALGGILYGTSQTVAWDLGFVLLLSMFAAVVLGGLGSAYGAMVGGLVIGLVSELSTYWLETEFKYATGLAVLIAVLLVRPQGILGIKERVG